MHHLFHHHQQGTVIVTVTLVMLVLFWFIGISLDFGHLFTDRTELQTTMDNCALAAAQELDGKNTALMRAISAGQAAVNSNNVHLQSNTWNGKKQISNTKINFKDASYVATTVAANAKYAQCQYTQSGIGMWLLQFMRNFSENTADYPSSQNIMALAVATHINTQTSCSTPVAIKPKTKFPIPDEETEKFKGNDENTSPYCTNSGLADSVTSPPVSTLIH